MAKINVILWATWTVDGQLTLKVMCAKRMAHPNEEQFTATDEADSGDTGSGFANRAGMLAYCKPLNCHTSPSATATPCSVAPSD